LLHLVAVIITTILVVIAAIILVHEISQECIHVLAVAVRVRLIRGITVIIVDATSHIRISLLIIVAIVATTRDKISKIGKVLVVIILWGLILSKLVSEIGYRILLRFNIYIRSWGFVNDWLLVLGVALVFILDAYIVSLSKTTSLLLLSHVGCAVYGFSLLLEEVVEGLTVVVVVVAARGGLRSLVALLRRLLTWLLLLLREALKIIITL